MRKQARTRCFLKFADVLGSKEANRKMSRLGSLPGPARTPRTVALGHKTEASESFPCQHRKRTFIVRPALNLT